MDFASRVWIGYLEIAERPSFIRSHQCRVVRVARVIQKLKRTLASVEQARNKLPSVVRAAVTGGVDKIKAPGWTLNVSRTEQRVIRSGSRDAPEGNDGSESSFW